MTEFKGTKGRWYHDKGNSLSIFHPKAVGVILATVHKTSTIGKHSYDLSLKETDEYKYNALLISKAPEMLEILIELSNLTSSSLLNLQDRAKILIKEATEL